MVRSMCCSLLSQQQIVKDALVEARKLLELSKRCLCEECDSMFVLAAVMSDCAYKIKDRACQEKDRIRREELRQEMTNISSGRTRKAKH